MVLLHKEGNTVTNIQSSGEADGSVTETDILLFKDSNVEMYYHYEVIMKLCSFSLIIMCVGKK